MIGEKLSIIEVLMIVDVVGVLAVGIAIIKPAKHRSTVTIQRAYRKDELPPELVKLTQRSKFMRRRIR